MSEMPLRPAAALCVRWSVVLALVSSVGCAGPSDCGRASGPPLRTGEPVEVELEIVDGRWMSFEADDGWWRPPGEPPESLGLDWEGTATATRVDADTVIVDIAGVGALRLLENESRIGCE